MKHVRCSIVIRDPGPRPDPVPDRSAETCQALGIAVIAFAVVFFFTRHWLPAVLGLMCAALFGALAICSVGARGE